MPKLTKTVVEAAQPRDKQYTIWCSDLPGFGVYILPTSKRTYFVDYRTRDSGVRRRMTIGRHGKITTEEARKLAIATLGSTIKGDDPAEERKTRRSSKTIEELCGDYLCAAESGLVLGKKRRPKKASTLATDRGRIKRHIIPLLGRKLVKDIERRDIIQFIKDVSSGKTATIEKTDKLRGKAVVEGGPGTAARTVGLLGGMLSYAVNQGIIDINPATNIDKPAYNQRKRRLSPQEFKKLGIAIRGAEQNGECWQAIAGIWLLALTGCRLSEIIELEWSEIDEAGSCFRLFDSKEGESDRPVGKPVFELVRGIGRKEGNNFVLTSIRTERSYYGGLAGAIERITKKTGFTDVTAHTLRHSFASVAGDLGYSETTIAAMLGQAAGTVTRQYIHHLDSVLIAAADKVAKTIRDYMDGDAITDTAKLDQ